MLTGEKLGAALAAAIQMKGVSKADVARHFDVKPPSIQGWLKNGRISKVHIEKLLTYFSDVVGPDHWGITNMEMAAFGPSHMSAPVIPAGASVVAYDNPDELDPDRYVWIDRYDINLSAGCGNIQWVVNQKDPICFRAAWFKFKGLPPEDCKALYVRGRSMEPVLQDYDTVLIDTSKKEIIDGDVYAVCLDDQFYIKAVHRKPGMVVLRSYNKDFEDIEVVGEQMNQLCIIGKMVWRGG
ncbi:LexA family transcriptional regulator [Aquitalea pelogenes]|uniref:LexA family transcriptional regulator n=1 Tax=Aquitalea pelogenes TaxID=1293573 RepID=UPI0035B2CF41